MIDKQIIIDSIDVNECELLTTTGHCKVQMSIMGTDANKCKCFPNCYYKQLKRKEQECKKLEQTLIEIKEIANYSFNCSTSKYMAKLELILEKINEVI